MTFFITKPTSNCGNEIIWLYLWARMGWWLIMVNCLGMQARSWWCIQRSPHNHEIEEKTISLGCILYLVYPVLGICYTWCIMYLVYAVVGVYCTWCVLIIMTWGEIEGRLNILFYNDGRVLDKNESDVGCAVNGVEDKSRYEESGVGHAW